MATPIKSLFPPIEKKPFLLNKQKKAGAVARRRVSTISKKILSRGILYLFGRPAKVKREW